MSILTKDQILASDDLPRELVSVPEWGGEVYVRGMNGRDRGNWETSLLDSNGEPKRDMRGVRESLCVKCLCDEQGQQLFSEEDVVAMQGKSSVALERVFLVAQRLSGITGGDVDRLSKNSEGGPNAAGG